jgi:hypothetical protein
MKETISAIMLNICIISLLDLKDLKFLLTFLDDSRICSKMAGEEHLQVIIEYPPPQDTKQLQRYMEIVYFYHSFTLGIAAVLKPLTTALKEVKRHSDEQLP